jgi:hypothetical protein
MRRYELTVGDRVVYKRDDFKAYGRFVRERRDDFAWENDRVAHRMYGAALETWAQEPLTSSAVDAWAYQHGVRLDFITKGKPTENGHIESFNGKFRDECLNENWFISLDDVRRKVEAYRVDYNEVRPHSSLDNQTPMEFARSHTGLAQSAAQ